MLWYTNPMDYATSSFSVLRLVPKFGDIRYLEADGTPPYREVADMLAIPIRRLISRKTAQRDADLAASPPTSLRAFPKPGCGIWIP